MLNPNRFDPFYFEGIHSIDPTELLNIFQQRRRAFVDNPKRNWGLPIEGSTFEVDQFDNEATMYVQAKRLGKGPDSDPITVSETVFSARVLPRDASMVATLWPDLLPLIPKGSQEVSRLVLHDDCPIDRKWNLWAAPRLVKCMGPMFAIADAQVMRIYSLLGIKPDRSYHYADDIWLVQWEGTS